MERSRPHPGCMPGEVRADLAGRCIPQSDGAAAVADGDHAGVRAQFYRPDPACVAAQRVQRAARHRLPQPDGRVAGTAGQYVAGVTDGVGAALVALQGPQRAAGGRVAGENPAVFGGDRQDRTVRAVGDRVREPADLEAERDSDRGRCQFDLYILTRGDGRAPVARIGQYPGVSPPAHDRGVPQRRAVEDDIPQVTPEQTGPGEVRAGEVRAGEGGVVEAGDNEGGVPHDRTGEVGAGQHGVGEVRTSEVDRAHLAV